MAEHSNDDDSRSATPALVQLTLLNVSSDLAASSNIEPLLNQALDIGGGCISACPCGREDGTSNTPENIRERVSKSVTRFVKPEDQYMALGSVLLKSRAYYQTLANIDNNKEHKDVVDGESPLPLVEIPRTEYGKPYIPLPSDDGDEGQCSHYPRHHLISVSHQMPYVGIARLNLAAMNDLSLNSALHVGLDIVTYQPPNPRLYNTTAEFLNVFKDSFTSSEWGHIVDSSASWFGRKRKSDDEAIREFYLRWAVKEAYTKALGVGMGLEFGTFEVRFDCCEDDGCDLFGSLSIANGGRGNDKNEERQRRRVSTMAKVVHFDGKGRNDEECSKVELWHFTFIELGVAEAAYDGIKETTDTTTDGGSSNEIGGCVCACSGPLLSLDEKQYDTNMIHVLVDEEWVVMHEPIRWHKGSGRPRMD